MTNPLVTPGASHNVQIEYDSSGINRIQTTIASGRYALLLRHSKGHWCGYTPVTRDQFAKSWARLIEFVHPPITYYEFANDSVAWMHPDQNGKLKIPVNLVDDARDVWVGFAWAPGGPRVEAEEVNEILQTFESRVHAVIIGG